MNSDIIHSGMILAMAYKAWHIYLLHKQNREQQAELDKLKKNIALSQEYLAMIRESTQRIISQIDEQLK